MGKIDDPLDQIEFQHREGNDQALAVSLDVAAPLVGLLSPGLSALATLAAFVVDFRAERRQQARADAFQAGLRQAFGELQDRVDAIEMKAVGPDAEDAVVTAIRLALGSARLDKARRFGCVVGATLRDERHNWSEAAEFIRNLEELSEQDLEAVRILWKVQRSAYRAGTDGARGMSTDANDYTRTWKDAIERASAANVSNDDWYSRCARLSGFGLTILVQPNPSFQGPDAMCYRLTGRAVRLLTLLGTDVDKPYPSWRYHPNKPAVIVNDEDEDKALGEGWFDRPVGAEGSNAPVAP